MKTVSPLFVLLFLAAPLGAQTLTGDMILDGLHVSAGERARLEEGEVLAFDGEEYESSARELAADATVLVNKSLDEVLAQIGDVPTIIPQKYLVDYVDIESEADFGKVRFDDAEYEHADNLLKAKYGKNFNLSKRELQLLGERNREARGKAERLAAASDAMREILIGRFNAYLKSGLEGIDVYQRSSRKAISIGRDLRLTTETFEPFEQYFPEYYRVLRDYPQGRDCCEHIFRWLKVEIKKRPVWALSHTIIQETDDFLLITERHFYVSGALNGVQVTLSWVPWDDDTQMGLAVSASTDVLDSIMGRMLRPLGRNKARDLVSEVLIDIRNELDAEEGAN